MTQTPRPRDPVAAQVQTVANTVLASLQSRLPHGVDRHLPAALRRNTPPDDPALWLTLDLSSLHPHGDGLDAPTYVRAATATTAAAQLWARTGIVHRKSSADRHNSLGALAARLARTRPATERDFARILRSHTLDEVLPRLRSLLHQGRNETLSLDYALLACDFYALQSPGGSLTVGQRWAHAFTQAKARTRRTTPLPAHGKADPA
ncbi:type I-E CRISPR-associated protein Cse2/CasB [Streptomyces sp. NBC_01433]|uniref:type I-E CRISPR-associated protein Cse2/CasB n=1 Tax=Streptomyces sp. NBC_01433 TaxID=2903864 RepID=UPI0022594842|nr:type I-E CRISPR-associated protein Cse2/CasB [Streptomyces sp. NBC_01433]MCX4681567.1 type I-E CRISPR-associated protein Cse2/CasB [Streptomyces sp. NBC_01433]